MRHIQTRKIVEQEQFLQGDLKLKENQQYINSFESTYFGMLLFSQKVVDECSQSSVSFMDSSIAKSKGLSVSLKKCNQGGKLCHDQIKMSNPQFSEEINLSRRKTASTLVQTAHTIHNLGRSLSKSRQDGRNRCGESREKLLVSKKFVDNFDLLESALSLRQCQNSRRLSGWKVNTDRLCNIKITPPKLSYYVKQKKVGCEESVKLTMGKLNSIKNKQFIRSSKGQSVPVNAKTNKVRISVELQQSNCLKPKNGNQVLHQVNNKKRSFLQNYIHKPMINSIIVSRNVESLQDEPESPVLRLKKRLELNSINCIYQKQTTISHSVHENSRIQVQQSMIVHRNILQHIRPIMSKMQLFSQNQQDMPYTLYLGHESKANVIVTVKQMALQCFVRFAKEIRVYEQLRSHGFQGISDNILQLIKHSTDADKHVIIKQPFTQTLKDYLDNLVCQKITKKQFQSVIGQILSTISSVITVNNKMGMVLKQRISLGDFVFVFKDLKFENVEMFSLDINETSKDVEEVLRQFRMQIEGYVNLVSSGEAGC